MARRDELARHFAQLQSTSQRRYEVCRACFPERQTDRQVADANAVDLTPHRVGPTQTAGLFLFTPDLLTLQIEQAVQHAGHQSSGGSFPLAPQEP